MDFFLCSVFINLLQLLNQKNQYKKYKGPIVISNTEGGFVSGFRLQIPKYPILFMIELHPYGGKFISVLVEVSQCHLTQYTGIITSKRFKN